MSEINKSNCCPKCFVLHNQCEDLKIELDKLNIRLDALANSLLCDTDSAATQTITPQRASIHTQIDITNENILYNSAEEQSEAPKILSAFTQTDNLDIIRDCRVLGSSAAGENSDVNILEGSDPIMPYLKFPDQPFEMFNMDHLDCDS